MLLDLNPGKNGHDRGFRSLFASSSGFWCWHFCWSKWNQGHNPAINFLSKILLYIFHISSNLNRTLTEGCSVCKQKDNNPFCRTQAKKILYASNGINFFLKIWFSIWLCVGLNFDASSEPNCFHASLRLESDYLYFNKLVELMVFYSIQVAFLKLLVSTSPGHI